MLGETVLLTAIFRARLAEVVKKVLATTGGKEALPLPGNESTHDDRFLLILNIKYISMSSCAAMDETFQKKNNSHSARQNSKNHPRRNHFDYNKANILKASHHVRIYHSLGSKTQGFSEHHSV